MSTVPQTTLMAFKNQSNPSPRKQSVTAAASTKDAVDAKADSGNDVKQLDTWERFWFTPSGYGPLRFCRIILALATIVWAAPFLFSGGAWFAGDGLLGSERLGRLVASTGAVETARWQWTPLYWFDSTWQIQLFILALLGCAACMLIGIGGRFVIVLTWLGTLALANREWVVMGLAELPLAMGLSGMVIGGMPARRTASNAESDRTHRWNYRFALRFIQLQGLAIVTIVLLGQWVTGQWIGGTGFVRMLAASENAWVSFAWLTQVPVLPRIAGTLVVLMPTILVAAMLALPSKRTGTVKALAATWLAFGILSGSLAYGIAVAGLVVSWLPTGEMRSDAANR